MKAMLLLIFVAVFFDVAAQNDTFSTKDEPYMVVEKMPEFPGGEKALSDYLKKEIKYPQSAIKDKIQGLVIVSFIVETDGSVSSVNVLKGVSEELDNEAVRVVKAMPKWTSGYQKSKAVRVMLNLPIRFQL
ncbi:MAG TPA: energy transducer TonB [Bacteroidia bacterium]|nr:energy transducer TonB [Bacteroidia bacterium]HRS58137.1 energy transducer TonB [Bacteroidia bacterium]HRU68752.1 energy transducer TonB [Bacteroidia bacterium]